MLVTLRLSEFFLNLSKLKHGRLVSFTDPFLNNVNNAPFWQSERKNSSFEIIFSLGSRAFFKNIASQRSRREKSRVRGGLRTGVVLNDRIACSVC